MRYDLCSVNNEATTTPRQRIAFRYNSIVVLHARPGTLHIRALHALCIFSLGAACRVPEGHVVFQKVGPLVHSESFL